jgi:putative DNA primase/helicase
LYKEYFIEKSIMLVGDGRNGKGKMIELLKRLVGTNNCCSVPLASLRADGFSISELFGKLFNLAGDIGNQDLKDTSMFKSLTGRDLVNGKRKFMNDLSFENYSKFVFACNELPMVYDLSKGFWDRWILLEFPYTFLPQEELDEAKNKENLKLRDPDIINEITTPEEMSGFLNQALIGLKRLKDNKNFSSTCGSDEVKETWIKKSNSFIAFCYNYIEDDYEGVITKKELRKKYSTYCKDNKIPPKSDFVIKRALQDMYGISEEKNNILGNNWDWVWVGIKWKTSKNDRL